LLVLLKSKNCSRGFSPVFGVVGAVRGKLWRIIFHHRNLTAWSAPFEDPEQERKNHEKAHNRTPFGRGECKKESVHGDQSYS